MTGMDLAIDEAEDGSIAMEKAFAFRPDVIITDLNMPGMSGQELVERIAASAELRATRVVVLSADRFGGRAEDLLKAGAAAYLTKPVTPERLRNSLITILGGNS
jgi:two-component system chemotaxis response regulator CheY